MWHSTNVNTKTCIITEPLVPFMCHDTSLKNLDHCLRLSLVRASLFGPNFRCSSQVPNLIYPRFFSCVKMSCTFLAHLNTLRCAIAIKSDKFRPLSLLILTQNLCFRLVKTGSKWGGRDEGAARKWAFHVIALRQSEPVLMSASSLPYSLGLFFEAETT